MSRFTIRQLHESVRVGFGETPWWKDQSVIAALIAEGLESPLYDGPIPVSEMRRLFGAAEHRSTRVQLIDTDPETGIETVIPYDAKQGLIDVATLEPLAIHGSESKWPTHNSFADETADILGTTVGDLGVESCGVLGAMAFVSIGVPETLHNERGGIDYRRHLLAARSLDGSLARTWKRTNTLGVCDNTVAAGLASQGATYKRKASKGTTVDDTIARQVLGLLDVEADEFDGWLDALLAQGVTSKVRDNYIDLAMPLPEIDLTAKNGKGGRGFVRMENKRDEWLAMYNNDKRCAPWVGTAFGLFQTQNTYDQHVRTVRLTDDTDDKGARRFARNLSDTVSDKAQERDLLTLANIDRALAMVE